MTARPSPCITAVRTSSVGHERIGTESVHRNLNLDLNRPLSHAERQAFDKAWSERGHLNLTWFTKSLTIHDLTFGQLESAYARTKQLLHMLDHLTVPFVEAESVIRDGFDLALRTINEDLAAGDSDTGTGDDPPGEVSP